DIHIILTHSRSSVLNYRVSPIADTGNKRMNWTMAHEVGHIMLGHLKDDEEEERQANNFASELLMPELVMLELKRGLGRKLGVHEVSRLFDVSQNAALNRISQMERRSRFSAYLKHEMMKKYKSLIDDYIEKNKEKLCQTITI
ncbi:MAG: ImmA/IrrE family metallo-endopeptidase, partial [Oscillospiraceae bacterium]|nr:ImmA/IrrE family metallo-endopeptidase [Oscillospiraceae bacterium]